MERKVIIIKKHGTKSGNYEKMLEAMEDEINDAIADGYEIHGDLQIAVSNAPAPEDPFRTGGIQSFYDMAIVMIKKPTTRSKKYVDA